jgi:hypothetical protein
MGATAKQRVIWPAAAGLTGTLLLAAVYLGIVTWAQGWQHAQQLFWDDRWIVSPIILGFGVQAALYVILRKRLFVPVASAGPSGPLMGASGGTSTVAMVACCLHHVTDVLPILGLTAATTFLAEQRIAFMLAGLGMTVLGIVVMLVILFRERHRALRSLARAVEET